MIRELISNVFTEYEYMFNHINLTVNIINTLALFYLVLIIVYNSYLAYNTLKEMPKNSTIIEIINLLCISDFTRYLSLISLSYILLIYRYNFISLFDDPIRTQLFLIALFLGSIGYIFNNLVIAYRNGRLIIIYGALSIIKSLLEILPFIFIATIFMKLK